MMMIMMMKRKRKKKGNRGEKEEQEAEREKSHPRTEGPLSVGLGYFFQYQGHPKLMRGCDNGT